ARAQQFGQHDVAHSESERRQRRATDRAEQVVVTPAATYRAKLAGAVEQFEYDAGVVREAANDREVELEPRSTLRHERANVLEESAQFLDVLTAGLGRGPDRARHCI